MIKKEGNTYGGLMWFVNRKIQAESSLTLVRVGYAVFSDFTQKCFVEQVNTNKSYPFVSGEKSKYEDPSFLPRSQFRAGNDDKNHEFRGFEASNMLN